MQGLEGGELSRRRPESSVLRRAVREGWPAVEAEADARGGLPRRVRHEVERYLRCGLVRYGFTAVRCDGCEEVTLVAFSCKSRGFCPSCAARRAHQTAAHLSEVLPHAPYRQWTLSLPRELALAAVKEVKHLRRIERECVRAIFRLHRRLARRLGFAGRLDCGAVCFVQLFNQNLALQPHLHLLVPDGVFGPDGAFAALPPPDAAEVESVLSRLLKRLLPVFTETEVLPPEDGLESLRAEGAQLRLAFDGARAPKPKGRRLALGMGFSLHADTHVSENDRSGLERLCRYGARGPIAESRLSPRDDGKYVYRTKRGASLVLTAAQLVRRLLWLTVPERLHLTNFHGVFAAHASGRASVVLQPEAPPCRQLTPAPREEPTPAAQKREGGQRSRPRLDWATLYARTWGVDVWTCQCGGKRKVLALVTSRREAEELLHRLGRHDELAAPPPLPQAQSPPQLELAV